jgi:lactate dehydrogenase-like 2-hydroxyacid dehydrogenase
MSVEIIVTDPVEPALMRQLEDTFAIRRLWEAEGRDAFLREHASHARGLVTRSMVGADAAMMDALPKLEIISVFGVGTDAVDLEAARKRGIIVTNTPGVLTDDTADYGMALLLALARKIAEGDRFVRAGRWPGEAFPNSVRVNGKKLGIVGLGRIGSGVARRAEAFGMEIFYSGPNEKPDLPYGYIPDITALAETVDFLILTCPGGPDTKGLVDQAVLKSLGAQGMLVNIARASVIDEAALLDALRDNTIKAAALDVFADEPHVPEAFLKLDNVLLAPHIASKTAETRGDIGDLVYRNIKAHFAGSEVLSRVV